MKKSYKIMEETIPFRNNPKKLKEMICKELKNLERDTQCENTRNRIGDVIVMCSKL